jgi:RNA polymerase sigma-70 factor (ECF subfamily)
MLYHDDEAEPVKQSAKEEFLRLLEPVYPRLSRYALAITRNVDEAKDLTSDAILIALEQFAKMKDKEHFAGFLFKVASRLHKRRQYRDRFRTVYNLKAAEALEDFSPKPDQAAEIAIVMEALEKLPEKMKEAIVLADVADLSLEEIRAIQGGTLSGVKSRLKRGREMLQGHLGIQKEFKMKIAGTRNEHFAPALSKGDYYAL